MTATSRAAVSGSVRPTLTVRYDGNVARGRLRERASDVDREI
jgi:hypothetical protein